MIAASSQRAEQVPLMAGRDMFLKRRWRGLAADGVEFGFDLESRLPSGALIHQTDAADYIILQEREHIYEIPFQSAEQAGELIPIAPGDGVALVFLRYALAPLICACEVREKAAALPLRMGIHVGPVTRVSDINGAVSVTGSGINTAKRVMDLADGGQIFLSGAAVALVREHDAWKERLEFVGERDTKHGERVQVWELVPWMKPQ